MSAGWRYVHIAHCVISEGISLGTRKRYGVPPALGLLPGLVTYLIDRKGIVRHIFSSFFAPKKHAPKALDVLQALREERK